MKELLNIETEIRKSTLQTHSKTRNHRKVTLDNVKILSKNIKTTDKRKIINEALFIRSQKRKNL